MMSSTEVTTILGQSDAVKEVCSVRKQALELEQQLITRPTGDKGGQQEGNMGEFESEKGMEGDAEKQEEEEGEDTQKGKEAEESDEELSFSEGALIDIKV
jgi:hypothetical protein